MLEKKTKVELEKNRMYTVYITSKEGFTHEKQTIDTSLHDGQIAVDKIIRDFRKKLKETNSDIKEFNVQITEERVTWNVRHKNFNLPIYIKLQDTDSLEKVFETVQEAELAQYDAKLTRDAKKGWTIRLVNRAARQSESIKVDNEEVLNMIKANDTTGDLDISMETTIKFTKTLKVKIKK